MDHRYSINSDYYAKCLRNKVRRDNKFTKLQNKILQQQKQLREKQQQPEIVKFYDKPEKQHKEQQHCTADLIKRQQKPKQINENSFDSDLLTEIDKSLVLAKGFVYGKGN